jgi:peptidoglycan hydrolase CwlO-like protein
MVSDELGKQLHDRATRGETLSVEEQRQLDMWYTAQDYAEMAMLNLDTATKNVTSLQTQVDSVLIQLGIVTKRIQEIAEENESLRKEVAIFRRKLAQQMVIQPV